MLVIAGPTGSGKSRLAIAVARRVGGEIVGCDALQVYRGFDAATAKPSEMDRRAVPHWLIDVADPRHDYSLATFVKEADAAIEDIAARGRVPIVAGGTGMYLRGLLKGIVAAPARDPALRERLHRLTERFGSPRLHRVLASLDAASAARLGENDAQRIVRAIELALTTGTSWSVVLAQGGTWSRPGERYRALKIGLDCDREILAQSLALRTDVFLAAGLFDEVEHLLAAGVPATANAFKGIGYRQVLAARGDGRDRSQVREEIVVATRQYAKRQRTWLRREADMTWLDAAAGVDALCDRIVEAWNASATAKRHGSPC